MKNSAFKCGCSDKLPTKIKCSDYPDVRIDWGNGNDRTVNYSYGGRSTGKAHAIKIMKQLLDKGLIYFPKP